MKRLITGLLGLALIFAMGSCTKENAELTQDTGDHPLMTAVEDEATAEYLMEYTEQLEDDAITFRTVDTPCVEVTWDQPQGTFPNTVTIDFGFGCLGPDGHFRMGKIIVNQSAPMAEQGALRETIFEGYSIDSIQIIGTKSLSNNGLNSNGQPSFTRLVDIELIFPDGSSVTRDSEITRTQIRGAQTDVRWDDVLAIEGMASGQNRDGMDYQAQIVEPLIKSHQCRWLMDGLVELTRDGATSTVDYGFRGESCDRLARLTFENGSTKIIHVHRRWW